MAQRCTPGKWPCRSACTAALRADGSTEGLALLQHEIKTVLGPPTPSQDATRAETTPRSSPLRRCCTCSRSPPRRSQALRSGKTSRQLEPSSCWKLRPQKQPTLRRKWLAAGRACTELPGSFSEKPAWSTPRKHLHTPPPRSSPPTSLNSGRVRSCFPAAPFRKEEVPAACTAP